MFESIGPHPDPGQYLSRNGVIARSYAQTLPAL